MYGNLIVNRGPSWPLEIFRGEKEYIAGNMDFLLGDRDQIPIDPVLSAAFFCVFAVNHPPPLDANMLNN